MPGDVGVGVGIGSVFNALVPRIAKGDALLAVQQAVGLSDITDMASCAAYGIQQRMHLKAGVEQTNTVAICWWPTCAQGTSIRTNKNRRQFNAT